MQVLTVSAEMDELVNQRRKQREAAMSGRCSGS